MRAAPGVRGVRAELLGLLVALQLEEHDLVVRFGDSSRRHRLRTPMLLPFGARRAVERPVEPVSDA